MTATLSDYQKGVERHNEQLPGRYERTNRLLMIRLESPDPHRSDGQS